MLIPQSVSYASTLAKLSPVTGLVSFFCSPMKICCQIDAGWIVCSLDPRNFLRVTGDFEATERGSRGCSQFAFGSDR